MSAPTDTTVLFLEQIIDTVHPLMAEGLYLAAVPHWYNASLFAAMRNRDDGRTDGLITRLNRYSFISPLSGDGDIQTYVVRADERMLLQRHWIAKDPAAYRAAHQRALAYWEANPDPNPYAQAQNRLYHLLFADRQAGMALLVEKFSVYYRERQFSAIDRLLKTAAETRFYLTMLEGEYLDGLDNLLLHLRSSLMQLRGQWSQSQTELQKLLQSPNLAPDLHPYALRSYGEALAHNGQYVEAIAQYDEAIAQFGAWAEAEDSDKARRAMAKTMIARGDAHAGLAVSVGGQAEDGGQTTNAWNELVYSKKVLGFLKILIALPLFFYLSFYLGRRVWHLRFMFAAADLDWIIARLFASAARMYTEADVILERCGSKAEGLAADEKLAFLYLSIGDADQAYRLFSMLLTEEEAPLGVYRRTLVNVGVGEAALRLQRPSLALTPLYEALPILEMYEDRETAVRVRALLGQTHLALAQQEEAAPYIAAAIAAYQEMEAWEQATDAAEIWERETEDRDAPPNLQSPISNLSLRQYASRYRHPLLVYFRRMAFFLLAAALLLIPLFAIHLESGSLLSPTIRFQPAPLLSPNQSFTPALNQGVAAANVALTRAATNTVFLIAIGLALAYFVLSIGFGLLLIVRTSLKSVQKRGETTRVCLDAEKITIGRDAETQILRWEETAVFIKADVRLGSYPLSDGSAFGVVGNDRNKRLVVRGDANWYASLRRRAAARVPAAAKTINRDHAVLSAYLGAIYIVNLGVILVIALMAKFAKSLLWQDFPGLPYSVGDLFPYLFMGLFLLPMWWGIIRPLRVNLYLRPRSSVPWWAMGAGVALTLFQILIRFRPLLTVVNVYPPLFTVILAGSGAIAIWRLRNDGRKLYPVWLRVGSAILAAIMVLLLTAVLVRNIISYHYLVLGNSLRDRGVQAAGDQNLDRADERYREAIAAYGSAIKISAIPILNIDPRSAAGVPFGIPSPDNFVWQSAMTSQGALFATVGENAKAVGNYTELLLLPYTAHKDRIYAWRGIAYQNWGTPNDNVAEAKDDYYELALKDYNKAIELNPDLFIYYLWRGVTYHALPGRETVLAAFQDYQEALNLSDDEDDEPLIAANRERAFTGQGWVTYETGLLDESRELFRQAIAADPQQPEAWTGLGYVEYALGNYDAAQAAWETALDGAPDDPALNASMGTLKWREARDTQDADAKCELYVESAAFFAAAAENAKQPAAERAYNYRTLGQVNSLLFNCDGIDDNAQYEIIIDNFNEAIALDPNNAQYLQLRGRWAYGYWLTLSKQNGRKTETETWLYRTKGYLEDAYALDATDANVNRRRKHILSITDSPLELEDIEEANGLALDALRAGDLATAAQWYNETMRRAALLDTDEGYNIMRSSRDDWYAMGDVETMELLTAVNDALPALIINFPETTGDETFWRYRAWFFYGMGLSAFRLGDETAARAALTEAQTAAVHSDNAVTQSYLKTGAWQWFYVERGDDWYAAGVYERALADYKTAVALYPDSPLDTKWARDEIAEAAFKAGLSSLQLGDARAAERWYRKGAALAVEYNSDAAATTTAVRMLEKIEGEETAVEGVLEWLRP